MKSLMSALFGGLTALIMVGHPPDLMATESTGAASIMARSLVQNSIYVLDLSSRVVHLSRSERTGFQQAVGIDYYSKVNSAYRDVATVNFQLYLMRIDNLVWRPGFFEGEDDWELMPRISNVNLHLRDDRRLNLKVGHMEIPYGAEVPINSNGTLRQMMHGPNLGVKADWGVSLNGTSSPVQYEVALTRGSGIEYNSPGDPYVVAGRIGNAIDAESYYGFNAVGVSFFRGDVLTRAGTKVQRLRLGFDGQWYYGPLGLLGEVSFGENDNSEVVNTLLELSYVNRRETWFVYAQGRLLRMRAAAGWDEADSLHLGLRWTPDNRWSVSSEFVQELSKFGSGVTESLISGQLRYRF